MTDNLKKIESEALEQETENIQNTSLILEIGEQLLLEAEVQYKQDNKFSDKTLLSLNSFYGSVLERALDVLDNEKFIIYQSNDNLRKIIKVKGSKSEEYTLFYHINFCTCQAFKFKVLHSSKELVCKHVLAARLAEIVGKITIETYTGRQIADILNNSII